MIPNYTPEIDPFTDLGVGEDCFRTWKRHRVFAVLGATCRYFWKVFYNRSWRTKVVTSRALPAMIELLEGDEVQARLVKYVSLPV
jgi:hypothetical protein